MSEKHNLVIVHGTGTYTAESIKLEVERSIQYAFALYDELKDKSVADYINLIPFGYNSYFEEERQKIADNSSTIVEMLERIGVGTNDAVVATDVLAKWESELKYNDSFKSHWLDVILYRYTTLAEQIRLKLAETIHKTLKSSGDSSTVSILGHSLGTSVVHDTLASMYAKPGQVSDDSNLDPAGNRLRSVHMFANVSRLFETFAKVDSSVVNPFAQGCTNTYYQYRHRLDPFVIPRPFVPVENGIWGNTDNDPSSYQELRPSLLTGANPHAIVHYLTNPECHLPLLSTLIDFYPDETATKKAYEKHKADRSLQGKAELLKQKCKELDVKNKESVEAFIKSGKVLVEFMSGFGQAYN